MFVEKFTNRGVGVLPIPKPSPDMRRFIAILTFKSPCVNGNGWQLIISGSRTPKIIKI